MRKPLHLTVPLALAVLAGGCAGDVTTPLGEEVLLAQQAQALAENEAQATHRACEDWLQRLFEALRDTDDPEAQAFLQQARDYRAQAREAFEAGQLDEARQYHELAFHALLSAVVEVFPDAPTTTGEVVDRIVARIAAFLGDREAPRIRALLTHVGAVRDQADAALAGGDPVAALALNLRGLRILRRVAHHIRDRIVDHDREADDELHAIDY